MKEVLILIDAGHGGLKLGEYTTSLRLGRKYKSITPATMEGAWFYEGLINRYIAAKLQFELSLFNIKSHIISDSIEDISLQERCNRANDIHGLGKYDCYFISIHFNASLNQNGHGFEVFVSKRASNRSIEWANNTVAGIRTFLSDIKVRREYAGVDYKAKDYKVLRSTRMPAILVEGAFYDTLLGQERITSSLFCDDLVQSYVLGIAKTIEDNKKEQ